MWGPCDGDSLSDSDDNYEYDDAKGNRNINVDGGNDEEPDDDGDTNDDGGGTMVKW